MTGRILLEDRRFPPPKHPPTHHAMHCLKCKGFMMVERHYTLMNRRLYARCLNCGFWIDLADMLRFFHKVIESGVRGAKIKESYTL